MTAPGCAAGPALKAPFGRGPMRFGLLVDRVVEPLTMRTAPRAAGQRAGRPAGEPDGRRRTGRATRTRRRRDPRALERVGSASGRTTGGGCFPAGRSLVPDGGRPVRRAPRGTPAGRGRVPGTAA